MRTKFRKRKAYGRLVVPFPSLICFSYFGFHALHGAFGLESASHLEERRIELERELASLNAEREALEKRVEALEKTSG